MLRVDDVTKQFSTVKAVDALSFEVRQGEIFALLGPNGAGKTTMVRMLVGILRPDTGHIEFSLESSSGRLGAADLGYLPEERGLHRDVPVLRTLEYFGMLHGMDRGEARERAKRGLEQLGLDGRERERIDALSKGNQQKVQFLSAVLHRPRFAVLDEPFSGFDPVNQQRFVEEIRRLRDEGCTILLSAHQMDLVETLADRILLLDAGRKVLSGSLEEIRRQSQSGTRLQFGIDPGAKLEDVTDIGGINRVDRPARDRVELVLARDADINKVLHTVTGRLRILSVQSGAETLREIFVRTVGHPVADSEEVEET